VEDTSIAFPLMGSVELGGLYLYFVVPAYVMVTANLANMHSGFNGLASGTALLVLISLMLKSAVMGGLEDLWFTLPLVGVALAFLYYNFYPSKIFEGDVGSFLLGAAIGVVVILQKLEFIGFVMLIPHTVDFLIYFYLKAKRMPFIKFGRVREDKTIEPPNPLKLKFLLPYYLRLTEKQTVFALYLLTAIFCIIGLLIPV
jgi:UDP-N-acetylglucosamine--dolichyl-phosphate N-acetylglucosaminephosphotransferase